MSDTVVATGAVKDTARIIVTLKCNMSCAYCCNEVPGVRDSWKKIKLDKLGDLWHTGYSSYCISGGEPFLSNYIWYVLCAVPDHLPAYIYTNGTALRDIDINRLKAWHPNAFLNIGLHEPGQLQRIHPRVIEVPHRWCIENTRVDEFAAVFPDHLKTETTSVHTWARNKCDMPNEDIFLLEV